MTTPALSSCDWQTTRKLIKERGEYLLRTGIWSDCRFIVGTEPNQQVLEGHKLFLAMSSPVFEAMFYGGMAEKDPIAIVDVQPEAFKALLEYLYTDKINLTSFDQACELCYGAKKYMLPHLVEECTTYLWSDLHPKNACRAYEFAKLFEEPLLMDKCIKIISQNTREVLSDSSFDDVELNTLLDILDQNQLNIDSELELFSAVERYSRRHYNNTVQTANESTATASGEPLIQVLPLQNAVWEAVRKIRFLTLTPQQFAEGPGKSNLLTDTDKLSILMNICSPVTSPMPPGFTTLRESRLKKQYSLENPFALAVKKFLPSGDTENVKMYCTRLPTIIRECVNSRNTEICETFRTDKNICIHGIQVPAQNSVEHPQPVYQELMYAYLSECDVNPVNGQLTYRHFNGLVNYTSMIDIIFTRPVYIQRNKAYRIGLVMKKQGSYPMALFEDHQCVTASGVLFTFLSDDHSTGRVLGRGQFIRSIIFSIPPAAPVNPVISEATGPVAIP